MISTTALYHNAMLDLSAAYSGPRAQPLNKSLRVIQQALGVADPGEVINFPPDAPIIHVKYI